MYYYKKSIFENDYQPDLLQEDTSHEDIDFSIGFPKKITLKNIYEVMIRRIQRLVLRYYKPSKHLHPEKFAYHLLLLF